MQSSRPQQNLRFQDCESTLPDSDPFGFLSRQGRMESSVSTTSCLGRPIGPTCFDFCSKGISHICQQQIFTASAWRLAKYSCNVLPLASQMIAAIACSLVRDVLALRLIQLQTTDHMHGSFTHLRRKLIEYQYNLAPLVTLLHH